MAFEWSGEGEEEEVESGEGKVDYYHVALSCVVIGEIRLQKCFLFFLQLDNPNTWQSFLYNDWLI